MTDISVRINGEERSLPGDVTIDAMLGVLDLPRQRVAIELNDTVVRRADWPATVLHDRDKIEVVHFVGGG